MKIATIYEFLDRLSPFDTQETWDNSGLLLGNLDDEIEEIYVSLDLDEASVEKASSNSLFITHHPLIFKGLKDLAGQKYPRNLIKKMLDKNIALICMHTNYDKSHLNTYFTEQILGFKIEDKEGFLIYVKSDLSYKELIAHVKKSLNLKHLRTSVIDDLDERVGRLAICTGSGSELLSALKNGVKCFLTGDLKYHVAFEAMNDKQVLIDIGHFESERCFAQSLEKNLQNLPIKVIISACKNPFEIF